MKGLKIILALIICLLVSCNFAENKPSHQAKRTNVLSSLKYDKVKAYDYNGAGEIEIIDKDLHLAKRINKEKELSKLQIEHINSIFCDTSSYGGDLAKCFNPHLGIVYYNQNNVIAYISVCLECNFLISSVNIPEKKDGFSKKGVNEILNCIEEFGFAKPKLK